MLDKVDKIEAAVKEEKPYALLCMAFSIIAVKLPVFKHIL